MGNILDLNRNSFFFLVQVEQLSETTGEESILLTASVSDGTLSHLGSESGKNFLDGHDEIKSQFIGFVLKSKFSLLGDNEFRDGKETIIQFKT